jgi:hypothetical protein
MGKFSLAPDRRILDLLAVDLRMYRVHVRCSGYSETVFEFMYHVNSNFLIDHKDFGRVGLFRSTSSPTTRIRASKNPDISN